MKYLLPKWLVRFGEKVAKIPYAKTLLKPIYYPYKEHLAKKRNQQFLSYGLEVLSLFDTTMKRINAPYVLGFGTLLGAVREHKFLSHDLDIDTCMWYSDYVEKNVGVELETAGFSYLRSFEVDDGVSGMEITFCYKNVSIDIFLIYPGIGGGLPFTCHNWDPVGETTSMEQSMKKYGYLLPYRFEAPYNREISMVQFYDLHLPIPTNYDDILSYRYGPDYMTPNPNWHDDRRNMTLWEGKKAVRKDKK